MINVKNDWWKKYFDQIYLITDARSVTDENLTKREVDLIEDLLKLKKRDHILDLFGGQGRHSFELARRGYKDLTVLDYSPFLIRKGRQLAKKDNLDVKFRKADARSTGLKNNSYTATVIMANSFGYFENEKDNIRVLLEARRLLQNQGKLLLDLTDKDYVESNLKSQSWHEANKDIVVLRSRELKRDMIRAREVVISKKRGLLRDGTYCARLYSDKKIKTLLSSLGYKDILVHSGLSLHSQKKDYGFLTSRMIVTASK